MKKLMGGFFGFLRGNKQRKGFTLAETLVVLAIIGIIAVLVLPVITTRAQNRGFSLAYDAEVKEMLNSLEGLTLHENAKSFNETIMNVPLNVNGEVTEDQAAAAINAEALDRARRYLQRYTKVARYCGNITTPCFAQSYSMYVGRNRGIFPLAGIVSGDPPQPYRVNGVDLNYAHMVCALLKNGMSLCISPQVTDSTGRMVRPVRGFIDLNGPKEPNVLGRDLRSFSMDLATRTITSPDAGTINLSDTEPPCEGTACCVQHYNEGILEEPDVNGQPHNCCETLQNGGQLTGEESLKYCCTINSDIADINDPCCDYLRGKGVSTENLPDECKEDSSLTPCEMFALGRTEYKEQCCATQSDPYWNNSDDTHTWDKACCVLAEYKDQCCANKGLSYWTPASKWNDECCNKEPYKTNDPVCNQCSSENWTDACCSDVTDDNPIWREKCCQIDEHKNKIACCSTTDDGKNRKGEDNDICCNNDAGLNTLGLSRNPECCYIKQWFANCCDVASGQKGTGKKDKNNRTWEDHCCSEPAYANEEVCCKADGKNGQGNVSQECCSFIENKNANCCEYMSQEDPSSPYGEYCCLSSSYDAEDPCCKVFGKGCPPTCEDDDYRNSHLSECCKQDAYKDNDECCKDGKNKYGSGDYTKRCCDLSSNTVKAKCCDSSIYDQDYCCSEGIKDLQNKFECSVACTDPISVGWMKRPGNSDPKFWLATADGKKAAVSITATYEYILYDVVDGACTNCSVPKTITATISKNSFSSGKHVDTGGKSAYFRLVSPAHDKYKDSCYDLIDSGTPCDCQTPCTPNNLHLRANVRGAGGNSERYEKYWLEADNPVETDVSVTFKYYFQHMPLNSDYVDNTAVDTFTKTFTIRKNKTRSDAASDLELTSYICQDNTTIGCSGLSSHPPDKIGYYFGFEDTKTHDTECYPVDIANGSDGCPNTPTTLDASWGCCSIWGEEMLEKSHNQGAIDACCKYPDLKERWALCGGCTPNIIRLDLDKKEACGRHLSWNINDPNEGSGIESCLVPHHNYNTTVTVTKINNVGCKYEPSGTVETITSLTLACQNGASALCKYCSNEGSEMCNGYMSGVPKCDNSCAPCNPTSPGNTCNGSCPFGTKLFPLKCGITINAGGFKKKYLEGYREGCHSDYNYSEDLIADLTYTATAERSVDSDVKITLTYYEAMYDNSGTYTGKQGPKTKTAKISKGGTSVTFPPFTQTWNKRIVDVSISSDSDGENGCYPTDNPAGSRPIDMLCADYEDDRSNPQWSSLNCCSLDDYYADASCCNGKYDGKGDVSDKCCEQVGTFDGPEDLCCNKVKDSPWLKDTNHKDAWLGGCCRRESGIMMADSEECCSFAGKNGEITSSDHPCCSIESIAEQYEVCQTPCDKVAAGTATEVEKKACCDAALSNSSIDHGAWTGRMSEWAKECCLVKNGNKYAYAGATPGMYIYADYTLELPGACCPYWQHENVLVYDEAAYNADPAHLAGACYMYEEACIKENFGFAAIANNVKGVCWLPCYNADGTPDTTKAQYCCDKWYADGKFNNGANSALKDTCCNEPINKNWDICSTTACPSVNDATPARATKECCSQWLTGANISTMLHPDRHDALAACCANDEWAEENPHAGYCCDITPHSSHITGCEPDECYSVAYRLDCGADGTPTPSFPGPSSCANVSNVKCKLTMDKPKCAEKVNGSTAMCVTVNYETTAYNASCGSVNTCTTLTQCGPDSVTILPAAYVYTFDGKGKFHWNADGANEVITGINGGLDGATTCSPWLYDSSYPVREIKGGVGSIYYSRSFSIINGQYRQ